MPQCSTFRPKDGAAALPLNDILARVVTAFPRSSFDREAAVAAAAERLKNLIGLGAPEEVLAIYRKPQVVRCRIAGTAPDAFLQFDAWDKQAIIVHSQPDGSSACDSLLRALAAALDYDYITEEYD